MAHGYLGDGYGSHGEIDPDSDRDRDRDRDRDWRERGEPWRDRDRDRDRGMMFGRGDRSEDDRWSGRSWRNEAGPRAYGNYSDDRRNFSANPDDHYRSWRDRHMSELDRDYQDYCRDREQQFHREFDDWRRRRYGNPQPLRTGMTQTGMSHDPSGELQLTNESSVGATEPDPTSEATLGTNSARGPRTSRNRG